MSTLTDAGDALLAERVAITARRLSKVKLIARTGRHQAKAITAYDDVYCVIDKPVRAIQNRGR